MKNFKNLLTTKNIFLITILVGLLIVSGVVVFSRNNSSINESENSVITAVDNDESEVEIEEEIKDGVYTNYTYGFSFEYDEDLLQPLSVPDTDPKLVNFRLRAFQGGLLAMAIDQDQYKYEDTSVKKGDIVYFGFSAGNIIDVKNESGYLIIIDNLKTKDNVASDHNVAYRASWIDDEGNVKYLLTLSVGVEDESSLKEIKSDFLNIVDSFNILSR